MQGRGGVNTQDRGIVHLALEDIFDQCKKTSPTKIVKVYISYFEIYNEVLIDLLNPKGDPGELKITEDEEVEIV